MIIPKKDLVPLLDLEEVYGAEDPSYSQVECGIDIAKIYLRVQEWLTWEEKAVFCYTVSGFLPDEISDMLRLLDENLIVQIKQTLIRKLQYAATSTQADIDITGSDGSKKSKRKIVPNSDLH